MPRAARKLPTDDQLYAAALRALMRRAHSVHEMRLYLERRAEQKAAVGRILARLKSARLLDDARYAREFARYRAESRGLGRYRIARELRARGVPDRHIEPALDGLFAEVDEASLLRRRLARRLRRAAGPLGARQLASLYRSLLRAGFSTDTIRQELRRVAPHDPGEFPEPSFEEE